MEPISIIAIRTIVRIGMGGAGDALGFYFRCPELGFAPRERIPDSVDSDPARQGGRLDRRLGGAGGSSPFGSRAGDQFTRLTIYVAIAWLFLTMIQVKAIQNDHKDKLYANVNAFGGRGGGD